MSIFDKLKNALFEEEYVEVEEKPKAKKSEKVAKTSFRETLKEKQKNKEKPFAKKIILPEKKDVVVSVANDDTNQVADKNIKSVVSEERVPPTMPVVEEHHSDFKFMDDDDFQVETDYRPRVEDNRQTNTDDSYRPRVEKKVEPQIVKVIEKDDAGVRPYQGGATHERPKRPYGIEETPQISVHEYGTYERKEDRGYFKPSPIISPIYGILDKNYKKDDIVTRKEIRLTSSYAKEKLNVDDVRKKAYGDLSDAIESVAVSRKDEDNNEPKFVVDNTDINQGDNLLVDLSSDVEKPSVKEVTMGDAVEYFQDLGLEYNVDYVDAAKNTTGRRSEKLHEEIRKIEEEEKKIESVKDIPAKETKDDNDDDNLFDLIDSMYRDNE